MPLPVLCSPLQTAYRPAVHPCLAAAGLRAELPGAQWDGAPDGQAPITAQVSTVTDLKQSGASVGMSSWCWGMVLGSKLGGSGFGLGRMGIFSVCAVLLSQLAAADEGMSRETWGTIRQPPAAR